MELATRAHSGVPLVEDEAARGYGYQFWVSEHGFYADGAFGQHCVVPLTKPDLALHLRAPLTTRPDVA